MSSLLCKLSPTHPLKWPRCNRVQIMCNTSSAFHVQPAVCHLVLRDSSAIEFHRSKIAFELYLSAEPLTNEGGEESGEPRENPWQRASE